MTFDIHRDDPVTNIFEVTASARVMISPNYVANEYEEETIKDLKSYIKGVTNNNPFKEGVEAPDGKSAIFLYSANTAQSIIDHLTELYKCSYTPKFDVCQHIVDGILEYVNISILNIYSYNEVTIRLENFKSTYSGCKVRCGDKDWKGLKV